MKSIPVPDKEKVQALLSQVNIANIQFQSYLQGVQDGLGLKGDWNLDTQKWVFTPMPKKEEK